MNGNAKIPARGIKSWYGEVAMVYDSVDNSGVIGI